MQAPDKMMASSYVGSELEIFQHATRWKAYSARTLRPYMVGDVLEVGAGLGGTSHFLCDGRQRSWTSLEPDADLLRQLEASLAAHPLPSPARALCSTVAALPADERFDTILYIDVLEHIDDDFSELARSATHLRPGGHIIVLAPAHQALYSPFDKAIGHFPATTRRRCLPPLRPCSNLSRRLSRRRRYGRIAGQPSATASIRSHRQPDHFLGSSARPRFARD